MMKKGIRILAIDDAPFTRTQKRVLVVGIIARDTEIEGVMSFEVGVDGTDATKNLIKAMAQSRFKEQVKLIAINGISLGGLNIVDITKLSGRFGVPVLAITRKRPRRSMLKAALSKSKPQGFRASMAAVDRVADGTTVLRAAGIYAQAVALGEKEAKGLVPKAMWALRIAHLVASGVTKGESKGRL